MFSRRSSMGSPVPQEKKKRFSWRRTREDIVAIIPNDDSVRSDTEESTPSSRAGTRRSTELFASLPPLLARVPRPDSVMSSVSTTDEAVLGSRARAPSSLGQVIEAVVPDTFPDGLPTYASTMNSPIPVTYGFMRSSPFAMVVKSESGSGGGGHALYHVSVGVNVWMPTSTVTIIRRGASEDGPIIAELELGISSAPATVLIGGTSKPLNQIFFRRSSTSSSRIYYTGDGSTIKWKLGANSWQAYLGSTLLATFVPTPPRKLTLQPAGHTLSDHVMISLLIIMREQLTPIEGIHLFNYSQRHRFQED